MRSLTNCCCPVSDRLIESPEVLYALFWDRQRRKVSEGGCVQLYGERYEPADGESLAKLFLEIERDVIVACDPANLGEAISLGSWTVGSWEGYGPRS